MFKFKKYLGFAAFLAFLAPSMASCSAEKSEYTYVYILNAEDYIDDTLITSFEDEVLESDGKKIKIIYETYDTNETMYNTLRTGKQTYDAICCSDYMIQRLVREGLVSSFVDAQEKGYIDNYMTYVSPYLSTYDGSNEGQINRIPVEVPIYDENKNIVDYDKTQNLNDYAMGYMWGTLGILYNPELIIERNGKLLRQIEEVKDATDEELAEYIIEWFNGKDGWSALWDKALKGTQSIKDSIRDTYAVGITEIFKDYFLTTTDDYSTRNAKFNSCDDKTIEAVQKSLIDLKENIFGFEVDSGKDDIVKKTIAVNIAWSGDAVNAINRGYYADEDWTVPNAEEDMVNLNFAIPELGANVWFDAWCLPKHNESYYESDQYEYAMRFLDYLSDPANAVANMSYNGYTTFIGSDSEGESDDILNFILTSYAIEDGEDEMDLSYYFRLPVDEETKKFTIETYDWTEEDEEFESSTFEFEDSDGDGYAEIVIPTDFGELEGRLLQAQFFDNSIVENLYVMRDFGNQNDKIVSMWENVKVNPLPIWVIVILVTFLVGLITYLGLFKVIKAYKVRKRKALREK